MMTVVQHKFSQVLLLRWVLADLILKSGGTKLPKEYSEVWKNRSRNHKAQELP